MKQAQVDKNCTVVRATNTVVAEEDTFENNMTTFELDTEDDWRHSGEA
jgi:hypothetical protein